MITSSLQRYNITCSSLTIILTHPHPQHHITSMIHDIQSHILPPSEDAWDIELELDVHIITSPSLYTLILPHVFILSQYQHLCDMIATSSQHDMTSLAHDISHFLSSFHLIPDIFYIGHTSYELARHITTSHHHHNTSLIIFDRSYVHISTCMYNEHLLSNMYDIQHTSCHVAPIPSQHGMGCVEGDVGMLLQTSTYRTVDQTAKG